ncbi:MAG: transposase [Bacillota bacterium]|nr:transposase [Bacillota bacterium]
MSQTFSIMKNHYSSRGPLAHDPADLLRSYLLMLQTGTFSITDWVDNMRRVPLYAILSGFTPGKTPGIGTFYDFFKRLWLTKLPNFTPKKKRKRKKPKKDKKKGEKAPTTTTSKVAKLVACIERSQSRKRLLPFDQIHTLFKQLFVRPSAQKGLLGDTQNLCLAGDGTPLRTSVYPRSKRTCNCRENGIYDCDCLRIYSQPDCDTGWDSYRECFFNGYHLYMFTTSSSKYDLPVYPHLHKASRHDSVSLLLTFEELQQRHPDWNVSRVLLDAAHDAMPIYHYFNKHKIVPLIDLNKRNAGNTKYKDDFSISPAGIPICKKGLEMKNNGYDHTRGRRKYRCPLVKKGVVTCDSPCSESPYGRCVYTYTQDNLRLFPTIARDSNEWKNTYKRRTTVERSNKREKVNYMLEAGRHRSTKMWTIRLYGIIICQHMDAWFKESNLELQSTLLTA